MKHVRFSIEYAGLQLPVVKNEQGEDCTPLKPVADLFGLQWERQRKKLDTSPFLTAHLGVCTVLMYGAGGQKREQTCIKVSRVAAFLLGLDPDRIRAHGNITGAEFLEQKLAEWADALHDYEELGIAINLNHARSQEFLGKQRSRFAQMIGIKNKTPDLADRKALGHVVGQMATELGIPYQPDLVDGK